MIAALSTITFGIVLWAIWTRRHTWRVKWETASTTQVTLMAVAFLLGAPPPSIGSLLNPYLHVITHVWNLQYWLSHICMLGATCAIVYNAVSRLDHPGRCPDQSFKSWFRRWIQVPTAGATLLLTALFCGSHAATRNYPNFGLQKTSGPYIDAYWIVLSLLLLYLLVQGIRAFIDLWDEPGAGLLRMYLAGSAFGVITLVIRLMQVFMWQQMMTNVMVIFALLSIATFAFAATWSWMKRIAWFGTPMPKPYQIEVHDGDDGQTV